MNSKTEFNVDGVYNNDDNNANNNDDQNNYICGNYN